MEQRQAARMEVIGIERFRRGGFVVPPFFEIVIPQGDFDDLAILSLRCEALRDAAGRLLAI